MALRSGPSHIAEREASSITAAGYSGYLEMGSLAPKSATMELAVVTSSSLVAQIHYSNDGSTDVASSIQETLPDTTGTIPIPIDTGYKYVRAQWVSGTATSVTAKLKANILGS